jgi:hypothetical protein
VPLRTLLHGIVSHALHPLLVEIVFISPWMPLKVTWIIPMHIEETSLTTIETFSKMNTNGCSDPLPKTFLQLKGISVANYNMGCNFSIAAALRLMIAYGLSILTIQEHTSWNRQISPIESNIIE